MEVTDTKALVRVLDAEGLEYEVISDTVAHIYGKVNFSQFVLALAKEECELISFHEQDESLENYFINLVGGGHHE